jgi:predicted TIM-barrel fold metal-dependent hydrolase
MMSRRGFVNSTLGAGLGTLGAGLGTLGAGLALMGAQPGAAQAPSAQGAPRKRQIVDAQVHLWKAESPDWQWVPGMKPQMPEPFTIEKLVPLMDEAGVDRVVVVPPSWPGDRNDYGLEAAKRYPGRFAVMGRIPLKDPQSANLLPKWKEQPGMLGVRVTFLGPAAAWLSDGTADWFWPAAEKAGLPVMFLTNSQTSKFVQIAERHPRLVLIADHMGVVGDLVKEGKLADAINQTAQLAKFPNASVKLSAAPNNSTESYPFKDFTPHIKRLYDAYGPQRCYWGTDMTNGFARAAYKQRVTHFTEELSFLSEDDKDWVMGRAILTRLGWS